MSRHPLALVAAVCAALSVLFAPQLVGAQPAPTAAFVDVSNSAVGGPLEAQLLTKSSVAWVERTEIDRVLQERKLQTLFAADGVGDRRALGQLVRADVLILLRTAESPSEGPRSKTSPAAHRLDLVVCETKQGLRLAVHSLPLSPSSETSESEQLTKLRGWVDEALGRLDRPARDIIAVPPLVSQDLTFEHDHLKRAFATLIEQSVWQRGDLAVVELAEAAALAKERSLATDEVRLNRPLPLYLLGEYRHDGVGDALRVTVRLKLMRGEQLVAAAVGEPLPPADAPAFLERQVGELLKNVSPHQPVPQDPQTEARQLRSRAQDLVDLRSCEEALPLIEAALLLEPNHEPTRREAIILCGSVGGRYSYQKETVEGATRWLQAYYRGLEHQEIWYAGKPDVNNLPRAVGQNTFLSNFRLEGVMLNPPRAAAAKAVYDEMRPKIVDQMMRIGRLRATQGETDAYFYYHVIVFTQDSRKRFEFIGDRILELQDLPKAQPRTQRMAVGGYTIGILNQPGGPEMLERLAREGNADVQEAVVRLRRSLEAERVKVPEPQKTVADTFKFEPKLPQGPTRIDLQPVKLQQGSSFQDFRFSGLIPAGPGVDLLWTSDELFLMKRPGVVRSVWRSTGSNEMFGHGRGSSSIVFDGRYIWAARIRFTGTPRLFVFDPQTEVMRDVTDEIGLPMALEGPEVRGGFGRYLEVAPLGPGRACVVGTFGRAWIAKVTFNPTGKSTAHVFHEFRRTPDAVDREAWRDSDSEFRPTFMTTLGSAAAGTQRVLVGRGSRNYALHKHPLLVDPEKETVEVLADEYRDLEGSEEAVVHNERLYYLGWCLQGTGLFRLGPPEWKPETLHLGVPQGNLGIVEGRAHIIGKRWWTFDLHGDAAKPVGPYVAESEVPWYFTNKWVYPNETSTDGTLKLPPETYVLSSVESGNHYGLLLNTYSKSQGYKRYEAVVRPGGEK